MNRIAIKSQTVVKHNRLFNLEPMGKGTANIESMTSYVSRLSHAYVISPFALITKIVLPFINVNHKPLYPMLNSIGTWAVNFILSLQHLTSQDDLQYLTMVPYADFIYSYNLCEPKKKWCPQCLDEWQAEGKDLYEPILWQLKEVKVCQIHKISLSNTCPDCNTSLPLISSKPIIGYCSSCNTWLGGKNNIFEQIDNPLFVYDLYRAENIGSLIAISQTRINKPAKDNIFQSIKDIVKIEYYDNMMDFCGHLDIPKASASEWIHGIHHPSLSEQLRLCFNLGISYIDFLDNNIQIALKNKVDYGIKIEKTGRGPHKRWEDAKIEGELSRLINSEEEIPSQRELMAKFQCEIKYIKKTFPILFAQIQAKRSIQQQNKQHASQLQENEALEKAFLQLSAAGEIPTTSQIKKLTGNPFILRSKSNQIKFNELSIQNKKLWRN